MKEVKVSFPQYGQTVFALPGTSVFECIIRAGILIKNSCAGQGTCGKCRVKVLSGKVHPSTECGIFFSDMEISEGYRLACKTRICEETIIFIPEESLLEDDVVVLTSDEKGEKHPTDPLVKKIHYQLPEPQLNDPVSDFENLKKTLNIADADLQIIRNLPSFLRENNFSGTAAVCRKKIISLEKGDTVSANFAVAVDLGTTTIVTTLINLHTGHQLGTTGILNPQTKFGDDVVSRIVAQSKSAENLAAIKNIVVTAINSMIGSLCHSAAVNSKDIYSVSIAGNTVMECLFCGIPVKALGEIPFAPPFRKGLFLKASELGLAVNPEALTYIFPIIGGFVGGDIVSGILVSRLTEFSRPVLFVDVGTNGEIVLAADGKMFAAAAAAGPAFEGARIGCGMRAANGAIEKVIIKDGKFEYNVIGNQKAKGICGTALIDAVAELLSHGIIDESGLILSPEKCPSSLSPEIRGRLKASDNGAVWNFMLTHGDSTHKPIILKQKDIRELQLASGAIRAAINIIMKKVGVRYEDLEAILIAGAFGNYIRRKNAKKIGLIPNIPDTKIRFVGNSSLAGARTVLLSGEKIEEAEETAERIHYVEISLDAEFQTEFSSAIMFPDQALFEKE